MNRKRGDTEVTKLAKFFVMDFLGRDGFDYRRDGMHLRHAKMLLRPAENKDGYTPPAYTVDQVINCIQAMSEGVFRDWVDTREISKMPKTQIPKTMLAVMWGVPPFIERMRHIEDYLPRRPDYYMKTEVMAWNKKYAHLLNKE